MSVSYSCALTTGPRIAISIVRRGQGLKILSESWAKSMKSFLRLSAGACAVLILANCSPTQFQMVSNPGIESVDPIPVPSPLPPGPVPLSTPLPTPTPTPPAQGTLSDLLVRTNMNIPVNFSALYVPGRSGASVTVALDPNLSLIHI